jgi:hypothetical protein
MIEDGDRFTWRGEDLEYLVHPYNSTALNERAVEVPIALDFIARQPAGARGIEVGNVLGHYTERDWRVVDLTEVAPGVDNVDVLELDPARDAADWLVAISTVEHVHPDRPAAAIDAVNRLLELVLPGGTALITVPFDQHAYLDGAILAGAFDADLEATLLFGDEGWRVVYDERLWRPRRRPHVWPAAVWVGAWL